MKQIQVADYELTKQQIDELCSYVQKLKVLLSKSLSKNKSLRARFKDIRDEFIAFKQLNGPACLHKLKDQMFIEANAIAIEYAERFKLDAGALIERVK